ncbi:MAG: BrnT family toxin [Anaerolineae bacterium]
MTHNNAPLLIDFALQNVTILVMVVVKKLIWDNWNVAHIARHQVTQEEVEEVCQGEVVVLDAKKGRLMVAGLTTANRFISVVLDPELQEGVYYPVTARSSSRKERRHYTAEKGAHDKAA